MGQETSANIETFQRIVEPHIDAGWNLARWLMRGQHDAEDVMQEAYLRAFRSIESYRGGDAKSWFLTIVRNLCHTAMRKSRSNRSTVALTEQTDELPNTEIILPLEAMVRQADVQALRGAIEMLPEDYRETLVLREFEGLSYKQIADVCDVPMGTVMSRLARARERLVSIMTSPPAERRASI